MEAQDRLISRPTRPLMFGIAVAIALAIAVMALLVATVVMQGARTSATGSQGAMSTASERQAPDAKERNDIYAAALAERFKNLSPDAQERNERANGR